MYSFILAIKIVINLLIYKIKTPHNFEIKNKKYYGIDNEDIPVKIFSPKKSRNFNLILYPGASPFAEEHPGMIMLGSVLAQVGYTVYIPRIPPLKVLIIDNNIVNWFEHFYLWLINEKKINHNKISLIGISFGGAITLKASINKPMKEFPPKSILSYGTYYNFTSLLNFLSTGKIRINNEERKIKPHPWGLIIICYNYLSLINTDYDSDKIVNILLLKINESEIEMENEIEKLSLKDKNLVNSILAGKINSDLMNILELIIIKQKEKFKSLSPKYWADKIKSKVFIFHGANDSMVPYTESIALGEKIINSKLFISYLYEHNEISSNRSLRFKMMELYRMMKFIADFIKYNEN